MKSVLSYIKVNGSESGSVELVVSFSSGLRRKDCLPDDRRARNVYRLSVIRQGTRGSQRLHIHTGSYRHSTPIAQLFTSDLERGSILSHGHEERER